MDACALASNRKVLARASERNYIHRLYLVAMHPGHAAEVLHHGEAGARNRNGIRLHLRRPDRADAGERPRKRKTSAPIKKTA